MSAPFDTGLIVVIISIVFFYVKLAISQWLRARKVKAEILKMVRDGKKPKGVEKPAERFQIEVRNWWYVAVSMLLIIFGLSINSFGWVLGGVEAFWWIFVAVGIVALSFSIK